MRVIVVIMLISMLYISAVDIIRYLIGEKQYWLMIEIGYVPRIWKQREKLFARIAKVNYIVMFCGLFLFYLLIATGATA